MQLMEKVVDFKKLSVEKKQVLFEELETFDRRKRPLNPMSIFNSVQVSSGVAVILLFGSLYGSAIFSAHHLNRHMDPTHSALLTGLKS